MTSYEKFKCRCGHTKKSHDELGPRHWERFNFQLIGYKDSPKNRTKFWRKILSEVMDKDWRCSKCECQEFRVDNLDWVEKLAKEKKLI